MVGMIFLHLAVNSQHQMVRRHTLATLEASAALFPEIVNRATINALSTFLSHDKVALPSSGAEETSSNNYLGDRLALFCMASFTYRGCCEEHVRKSSLVSFVVLAHHPAVGTFVIPWSISYPF